MIFRDCVTSQEIQELSTVYHSYLTACEVFCSRSVACTKHICIKTVIIIMNKYLKHLITGVDNKILTMIKIYSTSVSRFFFTSICKTAAHALICILLNDSIWRFHLSFEADYWHRICFHCLLDGIIFSDQRYFSFVAKGEWS